LQRALKGRVREEGFTWISGWLGLEEFERGGVEVEV